MAEQATASGEVLDSALFESKDDGSRWKKRRQGFFVKLIDWVSPFQERGGM